MFLRTPLQVEGGMLAGQTWSNAAPKAQQVPQWSSVELTIELGM